MLLTNGHIKAAQPRETNYKLGDGQGLFLLVTPKGTKSWRFAYRIGMRDRQITLGHYPEMGLADARELLYEARKLVKEGKDPLLEAEKRRQQLIAASEATFKKLAEIWMNEQAPTWSKSHAKRVRHRLENDLYPSFGKIPIRDIDGAMVLRALRKIEKRGSIETAKRVRGYIHSIFRRAKAERLLDRDAVMEIDEVKDALLPTPRGRRQPAMVSLKGLLELQQCVDRSTAGAYAKLCSRLLALTGVRIGVLRTATWDEFEGIGWDDPDEYCERAVWKISAARMKLEVEDKGNEAFGHDVPLSLQAIGALRALWTIRPPGNYLFPHGKTWKQPMTDAALSGLYKRMAAGKYKGRMVPHGWRTAFSTLMNERAAELERDGDRLIIDMILAHVPPGMSASEWAYNRARYFKPRAKLLQIWADLISEGLRPPAELIIQSCDS